MLSIGERMVNYYEDAYRIYLPKRMPVIVRLDGKCFHSLTKKLSKPYDDNFMMAMGFTAKRLWADVQNCVFAYIQSDEISLLLHNYKRLNTESYFGNNLQKIVSVTAGIASTYMTDFIKVWVTPVPDSVAVFDARAFILPESEVCNYFIWRQQDAIRNSIQGFAQSMFSRKELNKKKCDDLQEMMFQQHGFNWNDVETHKKRGYCVYEDYYDTEPPDFTKDRSYIEKWLNIDDEEE